MTTTRPYGDDPYRRGSVLSGTFLPLALITVGVMFLLSNVVPDRGRGGLIVLGLGVAFAIGRLTTGRYGYAVPAGILTAAGLYATLHDPLGLRGMSSAGGFFVMLGLGFAAIYFIGLRPVSVWPLVPAAILTTIGLVLLGVASLGPLASWSWIAAYWPAVLVLLGAWLLFRDSLPPSARKPIGTLGGIALLGYGVLAALATVAAGSATVDSGGFARLPFGESTTLEQPIATGQTLTIKNTSGQTTITGGSGSVVRVVATPRFGVNGRGPNVSLVPDSSGLRLESASSGEGFPFGRAGSLDYVIEVPAAVAVDVQSTSGAVSIKNVSGAVHAHTTSGSLSVEGVFTEASEVTSSSGSISLNLLPGSAVQLDVHSDSGSVEPRGGLNLTGGVTNQHTLTGTLATPAAGAKLTIQSHSGSISVSQ